MQPNSIRDVFRRWHSQIQGKRIDPRSINLAGHTIIPDKNQIAFPSNVEYVPIANALDVIVTTALNTSKEPVGINIKAYKSSFDNQTNTAIIGGYNNLVINKDLTFKPFKNAWGKAIDRFNEISILNTGLEVETERSVCINHPNLLQPYPEFTGFYLGFSEDNVPEMEDSWEIRQTAFDILRGYYAPPTIFPPRNYEGEVQNIYHCTDVEMYLIELSNHNLMVEVPIWGKLLVNKGQKVNSDTQLANLTFNQDTINSISDMFDDIRDIWSTLGNIFAVRDLDWLCKSAWKLHTIPVGSLYLLPSHFLSPENTDTRPYSIWRKLTLGRNCHHLGSLNQVIRSQNQGAISVWDMKDKPSEETLTFGTNGLIVDLFRDSALQKSN